ncbi:MAG: two-component system NtrC family sensor kinase, partial [Candidatus Omnitrophota bacterium]
LCLEQNQDDDVLRGYLLEVKQGLNRMATIVRNLLACSRSDVLSCEKIGFTQALDHALFSVQSELSHKSIIVKKEIEADLPEILDLGLERILTNLICNGIDAIEDEGIIIIKAFIKNDVFIFSVKDSGVGVGDVDLDQIIEPFYTTKDIDKGCGLGLTIISEIIKSYDGKINVESKEGEGAIFTVSLPLERANHG